MAGDEEGCDGKEVVCEVTLRFNSFIPTVNHEPNASFREDELKEVVTESCKSVAVYDHNLRDHAIECAFQKGAQPDPLEVDTRGDVLDKDVLRVRFLEVGNLAVEVGALLGTTDTSVDVAPLGCVVGIGDSEQSSDTIDAIESLTSGGTNVFESSGGRPTAKCGCGDAIDRGEVSCWFEHIQFRSSVFNFCLKP